MNTHKFFIFIIHHASRHPVLPQNSTKDQPIMFCLWRNLVCKIAGNLKDKIFRFKEKNKIVKKKSVITHVDSEITYYIK